MTSASSTETRRLLLSGVAAALAERGWGRLTVADIALAAGLPRSAFYEEFADKRDCVLIAHCAAFDRLMAEITRACGRESQWPRRLRAAVAALFALAAAEPERVRLLALGALRLDGEIGARVRERDAHLAALLREGRHRTRLGAGLPTLTEETLVAGVATVLDDCLREPHVAGLAALEPEIAQLLLLPYVGPAEAAWIAAS
jgi:AcrR family transcriptional regulator